jgi:hypothetical protein
VVWETEKAMPPVAPRRPSKRLRMRVVLPAPDGAETMNSSPGMEAGS